MTRSWPFLVSSRVYTSLGQFLCRVEVSRPNSTFYLCYFGSPLAAEANLMQQLDRQGAPG